MKKTSKTPQRKPNKTMSGDQLLSKAVTGRLVQLNEIERRNMEWQKLANEK